MSNQAERRRSKRRPILESFSLAVVLKNKSDLKLTVLDISDHGLAFEIDIDGEALSEYTPRANDTLSISLYLNQTLYIPLKIKVIRVSKTKENRSIGGEFLDQKGKSHLALLGFLETIDRLVEVAEITEPLP